MQAENVVWTFKNKRIFTDFIKISSLEKHYGDSLIDWLCWGFTTRQPLLVILCCLPEKGRKEIDSRGDEKEG